MEEIREIKQAVSAFFRDSLYVQQKRRWDGDFNLFRLIAYEAGAGYYSYTTNAPRVLAKKSIGMLCQANLLIRFPLEQLNKKQRGQASVIERYLYGAFNLNDDLLGLRGLPPLRDQMAFLSTIRGGFLLRDYITTDEEENTIPEVVAWDIYRTAYLVGATGLDWACRVYKERPETLKQRYPNLKLIGGTTPVTVYDFWDKKNNGVIVGNEWAKPLEAHGLNECPVHLFLVGAMPIMESDADNTINKERGDSIYDNNRDVYPIINKTLSDLTTIVRRGVKVPLGVWSADGKKTLDEDIWQVEKGSSVGFKTDEKIEALIPPSMPVDVAPLLNILSGDEQRGGFAHTTYGELGFRLSGFAINQLQGAILTIISPYIQIMERAYTRATISLLKQYNNNDLKPIEVQGRTSRNEVFGFPEKLTIKPKDVKKDWYPEIRLEPTVPKDDAQQWQLAQIAKNSGLLSTRTIQDELLGVRDTDLEQEKIEGEWANALPAIRLEKMFWSLMADGRFDLAQIVFNQLQRTKMELGITQAPEAQATALEGLIPPGGGMPPEDMGGMGPGTLPPETMGGMPPGAKSARMPLRGEL